MPALAPRLPLPVPVPQRLGAPSERYPRPWIVTTWVRGEPADRAPVTRGRSGGRCPGRLPVGAAPARPGRGAGRAGRRGDGPLADSAEGFARLLDKAVGRGLIPDPDPVRAVWEDAVAAPPWAGPAFVAARGPAPGQRSHRRRHLLRRDRLRRPARRRPGVGPCRLLDPAARPTPLTGSTPPTGPPRMEWRAARAKEAPGADAATRRRARGWAAIKALVCLLIGDAGDHGRPGGKPTWGPPARASLERLTAVSTR